MLKEDRNGSVLLTVSCEPAAPRQMWRRSEDVFKTIFSEHRVLSASN